MILYHKSSSKIYHFQIYAKVYSEKVKITPYPETLIFLGNDFTYTVNMLE